MTTTTGASHDRQDIEDGLQDLLTCGVIAQARLDPESPEERWQIRYVTDRGYEVAFTTPEARAFIISAVWS